MIIWNQVKGALAVSSTYSVNVYSSEKPSDTPPPPTQAYGELLYHVSPFLKPQLQKSDTLATHYIAVA